MNYAIVGDIHGEVGALEGLLPVLEDVDQIVFVGDYINRGPSSREVIEVLLELRQARPETVFLRGNHEELLCNALLGATIFPFLAAGGAATVEQYCPSPRGDVLALLHSEIPPTHIDFLLGLASSFHTQSWSASHIAPRSFSSGSDHLWVCGHSPTESGRPILDRNRLFLDTGAGGPGGQVSVALLPSMTYVQASATGEIGMVRPVDR